MEPSADLELLRRFEPILRFTRGEKFFPMDAADYVRECSLWVKRRGEDPVCVIPEGELSLERLAEVRSTGFESVYYLKFIEPLNLAELAAYHLQQGLGRKDRRDVFHAGRGRLARVGYFSRFVDALFSISLLARGRVTGDTAAAAAMAYRNIRERHAAYCYHGRVTRRDGWIALQYWFFYPFNDWRSGFFGVNDHEADWEMVSVYLAHTDSGEVVPEWVAYAAHDHSGDDLRRRWDDPELEKIGAHPVVYIGAGSHAGYFRPGEYLAEVELSFLSPLARLSDRWGKFWRTSVVQADGEGADPAGSSRFNVFRIPFVDYARGDGLAIGPGAEIEWGPPRLLSPPPDWVLNYRGLWGLYARDPISGENAPAGPPFNRDGTVRRAWYDPLGWAGLDKLPPHEETLPRVMKRRAELEARREARLEAIAQKSDELVHLGVEEQAMQGIPYLKERHKAQRELMAELSAEIDELRKKLNSDEALLQALDYYAERLRSGARGPARAHIERPLRPDSATDLRLKIFAEFWAAISIGLMLIGFVAVFLFFREYLIFGLAALLSLIIFLEAGFRRQISRLVTSVTIGLAVASALVLLSEFFWEIVVVLVLLAGGYIMWENLRELFG